MAFWSRKSLYDEIVKYLKENNVTISYEDDILSFELYLNNKHYSLFPYLKITDDFLSVLINIKKEEEINIDVYNKLNDFNIKSKFFKAIISSDNILYLEYNATIDSSNGLNRVKELIENVLYMEDDIDLL